ncbi:oxidoreductase [Polynucleobacter tropicus]|uniref:Oxidoreductase n=1 Tax=Polynucleobacter tropicus TaxID=1743174 RepID=A0A6M9PS57_9BURK|nr:zinc-binding alcohol dehydrogenase family protein [Polynucleobacter tropicus]QKM65234.1 oxidoreductase [Polynucleobacter tropicus]
MTTVKKDLRAIRLNNKASTIDDLLIAIEGQSTPNLKNGEALVRVYSAGVNPSDVKAALGIMPKAVFPRIPGRDFSGVVVDGPPEWLGKEVWGSGGDVGITQNGSHAGWLVLPVLALHEKPINLSFEEAGSVGVPFVTAYEGFRRSGMPKSGQTVVVMGANGKVGQAAVQIAAMNGANVIAVQRSEVYETFACSMVNVVNSKESEPDEIAQKIMKLSNGKGADIIFNTVGSPYFEAANKSLAKGGTQIFIATQDRAVPFDIFTFYRGMHTYVGIDTLALDCIESTKLLNLMRDGFESNKLKPFKVDQVFDLEDALKAYKLVLGGSQNRVVFKL